MKRFAFVLLGAASLWFLTTLPLTVLAVMAVAAGAFALGLMCGWLGGEEHRRQRRERARGGYVVPRPGGVRLELHGPAEPIVPRADPGKGN